MDFNEWIKHVFDHPVHDPAWYWDDDAPYWKLDPNETVAFLTELFEEPESLIDRFTPDQIGQGIEYICTAGMSDYLFVANDEQIPWQPTRERLIRAIVPLYANLWAHICDKDPDHNRTAERVCFMFWDVSPLGGGPT